MNKLLQKFDLLRRSRNAMPPLKRGFPWAICLCNLSFALGTIISALKTSQRAEPKFFLRAVSLES